MPISSDYFDNKALAYDEYRPKYPSAIIGIIAKDILDSKGLSVESDFNEISKIKGVDIGSGTALMAQYLSSNFIIYSVDPNKDMNEVAVKNLTNLQAGIKKDKYNKQKFLSKIIHGEAVDTGLKTRSMDFITMATSSVWFVKGDYLEKTIKECNRILKPSGKLYILMNVLDIEDSKVQELRKTFGEIFKGFHNGNLADKPETGQYALPLLEKLEARHTESFIFNLDLDGFKNWIKTHSFSPTEFDRGQEDTLNKFFDANSADGKLGIAHKTELYIGPLKKVAIDRVANK